MATHSYDLVHQNLLNQEESKVNPQEHLPMEPSKTPKSKPFQRVCWIKITKQRDTRSSYVTSNKNPSKKRRQILSMENPRKKAPKITKKEKREEHKQALRNRAESSIHTMKGSYKV
jgi:hypothetical protein